MDNTFSADTHSSSSSTSTTDSDKPPEVVKTVTVKPTKVKKKDDNDHVDWHYMTVDQVCQKVNLESLDHGLSSAEAAQRLSQNGPNVLDTGKSFFPLWLRLLWNHTVNVMNGVLLFAAILSIVVKDYVDFGVILVIILVNIIIGFLQEYRSESTMSKLKQLTAPMSKVVRDGKKQVVASSSLVVGDIVILKEGDQVPADLRLFHCVSLECHEALLTGESVPIPKHPEALLRRSKSRSLSFSAPRPSMGQITHPPPSNDIEIEEPLPKEKQSKKEVPVGDRTNSAFMSTTITKGKGSGIVVSTGSKTEIGKIAKSLGTNKNQTTPLQRRMSYMGITLMIVAVISLGIVLLAVYLHKGKKALFPDALMIGITIAVAIIPESLVAVVTLTMSIGVRKMVKQNAIVRKLAALESLGSITDICTDKTGTLTEGKMVAKSAWINGTYYKITTVEHPSKIEGKIMDPKEQEVNKSNMPYPLDMLITVASLCNSSSIAANAEGTELVKIGDPTELALNMLTHVACMTRSEIENSRYTSQVADFPFDSTIKRMSAVYALKSDNEQQQSFVNHVLTKGAPEGVLGLCNQYLKMNEDGTYEKVDMTVEEEANIRFANEESAKQGLRVLCLAYKDMPAEPGPTVVELKRDECESNLVFIGLVAIQDPPRAEVYDAIKVCDEAGILVHMLTGDHYTTAKAISEQVGILKPNHTNPNIVMKASEFDNLTPEELKAMSDLPLVVARCSPQTKVKMVDALHAKKRLCAMTGDGVNDSPSIKAADIGIAMGKGGSDVTKEAADIILTDDNFSTIVLAIKEGRRIFANIRKFVIHLLSANVAQLFVLLIPVVAGYDIPLNPTQILWLNMITGTPPALSLGVEKPSKNIMKKRKREGMFSPETVADILFYGSSMAAITLVSYFLMTTAWLKRSLKSAQAVSFTSLTLMLLFHAYNCRHKRKSFFRDNAWRSWLLHASIIFGVALQCITIYVPWINTTVFQHVPLKGDEWAFVAVGTVAFMGSAEVWKLVKRLTFASLKCLVRSVKRTGTATPPVELESIVLSA